MRRIGALVTRAGRSVLPRSLRRQVALALSALALLFAASNLIALFALHRSADTLHILAEERVVHVQDAQDLVASTLLIEREARRMVSADSVEDLHGSHGEIIRQLQTLDGLVERLGRESGDLSVLSLHQSGQLFRNGAHILAGLRENVLRAEASFSDSVRADPLSPRTLASEMLLHRLRGADSQEEIAELRRQLVREAGASRPADEELFAQRSRLIEQQEVLGEFYEQLEGQSVAMVTTAQGLSHRFTTDYREAVERLAARSREAVRWAMVMLVASLLCAFLVSRLLLGRHVLVRLQQVSHYLRRNGIAGPTPTVPVRGDDEIGEMARAVEKFMEDRKRLYVANRELEAFSYSVAHDLRAPLRAINGFADLLLQAYDEELGKQGQHCVHVIHRNAVQMGKLIDDILNLSRATRLELSLAPVDMAALAREVFEEVRAAAPGRNVVLRLGDLPFALGDPALLRQVLVNLLSNAVKFTSPRSEAVIEVDGGTEGGECVYRVRDNGVGFDTTHADKLFTAFERLHAAREFEGTGVGLAIVKRVVERHGGRVWAESTVGEGATFHFALPRAEAPRDEPATANHADGERA